jgi:hypothetical protein
MKSIKFRKKRIFAICFSIFLILIYHETIINQFDKLTMPDSSELCKIASEELRNYTNIIQFISTDYWLFAYFPRLVQPIELIKTASLK